MVRQLFEPAAVKSGSQPRAVDLSAAVRNKLLMLLVPVLKRWTYTRTREQVAPLDQS